MKRNQMLSALLTLLVLLLTAGNRVAAQNTATLALQTLNPQYSDVAPLPGVPLNEYGRLSWHSLEPAEGRC